MLMQFLRTLLFGISDTDPVTLIAVAALITIVALVACYLPVRRALPSVDTQNRQLIDTSKPAID
jgi:hypothetical protein